jgi:hypothetical protein
MSSDDLGKNVSNLHEANLMDGRVGRHVQHTERFPAESDPLSSDGIRSGHVRQRVVKSTLVQRPCVGSVLSDTRA